MPSPLEDLEPEQLASFRNGQRKARNIRDAFGDKDVIFYLRVCELIDAHEEEKKKCGECRGKGKVECGECNGSGEVTCDCQE